MAIRPSLLVAGQHDPASLAGHIAFLELDNSARARYLKVIEYMTEDVGALLGLLTDADRAEVLAYRDECGSPVAWP